MQPGSAPPPLAALSGTADANGSDQNIGALGGHLRRRLLALLIFPLCVLAAINAALDYRIAGGAAVEQDAQLQRLAPLLADSLVAWQSQDNGLSREPVILMAPPVEEFLKERANASGYRLSDLQGRFIAGDEWIEPVLSPSDEAEISTVHVAGISYRIVSLKASSRVGDVVVQIADGSDPRQQWWRAVLLKVLLPNLVLMVVAFFVVRWAVSRALAPLMALAGEVQHRSPTDLQPIDPQRSPQEVRPLVDALNRLFGTVNTQVENQRRFVADAAHQLRTPLTGLQSQVEAWVQHTENVGSPSISLSSEQVLKLRDATRRTTQLANQLLSLSRVDAQAGRLDSRSEVNLRELCVHALHKHLDAATQKEIDLGLDAQEVFVSGHEWLLGEALSNLVDNAIKYTPKGGRVTIACGQEPGEQAVCLQVRDSGPGIAPDERGKVTERFYRSPKAAGAGNGLGLAIVHEIAKLHQAELVLGESKAGQGLRASLIFAVRESAP